LEQPDAGSSAFAGRKPAYDLAPGC
jgi:hypothetical protein